MKGLKVLPGLIDPDYLGEIRVMIQTETVIFTLPQGTKIAQILLLPFFKSVDQTLNKKKGTTGFGSTDVYFVHQIGQEQPELTLTIENVQFIGLLDTGADVSVMSQNQWPSDWPLVDSVTHLKGIGAESTPKQSVRILTWSDAEGHTGTIQPYVLPDLPLNLWGRDVLTQMGAYLYSPSSAVTNMMCQQNYYPGQGMGKDSHGIIEPIQSKKNPMRRGLGFPLQ